MLHSKSVKELKNQACLLVNLGLNQVLKQYFDQINFQVPHPKRSSSSILKGTRNANIECKYFGGYFKYCFCYFFSPLCQLAAQLQVLQTQRNQSSCQLSHIKDPQILEKLFRKHTLSEGNFASAQIYQSSTAQILLPASGLRPTWLGAYEKHRTSLKHPWARTYECQKAQRPQTKV